MLALVAVAAERLNIVDLIAAAFGQWHDVIRCQQIT
jgi:hypothetical protein